MIYHIDEIAWKRSIIFHYNLKRDNDLGLVLACKGDKDGRLGSITETTQTVLGLFSLVALFDGMNEAIMPHVTSQLSPYTQKGY